jgi:hypothetical protein
LIAAGTIAAIVAFSLDAGVLVLEPVELVEFVELLEPQPAIATAVSTGIAQTPSLLIGTSYVGVVV